MLCSHPISWTVRPSCVRVTLDRDGFFVGYRMWTVRTPEKEQVILEALRERPSFAAACRKARIARSLFYRWRKEDPEFDRRVLEAREQGLDALEDALVTRGMKNDTTAAIFLLKSHRREIYGDKLDINLQIRKKAEQLADELGISADDLIQEAEAIAASAWQAWEAPR